MIANIARRENLACGRENARPAFIGRYNEPFAGYTTVATDVPTDNETDTPTERYGENT
ncbi:MAG: hypothetical protein IPG64_17460 [Haliea sp.]|nr:hypothetical protein [Haliea sp.]